MLPDRYCQLLTAYIDGELGKRQRKTVVRLLRRSSRARTLFRQLKQDAARLHSLPQRQLPAEFPTQVLRAIATRGLRPTASAGRAARSFLHTWIGVAAAAAVFLAVTTASYLYFAHWRGGTSPEPIVVQVPQKFSAPLPVAVEQPRTPAPRPTPEQPKTAAVKPAPEPHRPPQVRPKAAAPPAEPGWKVALGQLSQDAPKKRLAKELQKTTSYHLNVATTNTSRTVEQLASAFQAKGIQLLGAGQTQARLKQKQPPTKVLLYAENLQPQEVAAILEHLGKGGKKAAAERNLQGQVETVALSPMTGDNRRHLARLMGVAPDQLQPGRQMPPGEVPLLKETIIAAPAGRAPAKPGEAAPKTAPAPERLAVVLAYNAEGGQSSSEAVQAFLRGRPQPQPGTIQILLELQEIRA